MDYQLHLRVTSVASPTSGQPHAGGPGAGDVILDQVIDLRQWVAERLAIDPVEPAVRPAPVPAVVAPAPKPALPVTPAKPLTPATQTTTNPAVVTFLPTGKPTAAPESDQPFTTSSGFGDR